MPSPVAHNRVEREKSWIRGKYEGVQSVDLVQVIPIDVIGNWHLGNNGYPVFLVKNERAIEIIFSECLSV